jgi:transcriptional regulator GlxA family with amidase domain
MNTSASDALHKKLANDAGPTRIGFLLIDGFALLSYASVIEPFRAANTLAKRTLYSWKHISVGGDLIRASNGVHIVAESRVGEDLDLDVLLVCAGGNPSEFHDESTYAWLRRMVTRVQRLGGVSGGPFILARAGLLNGYRCTIHWEHLPAFVETFPELHVEPSLFVIDRNRLTCAGGIAGLDMAIDLIGSDHGPGLATKVGEWYIRTEARAGRGAQRASPSERYGTRNGKLLRVLVHMESHVEEPATRAELAALVGVSVRQLERLFAAHMHTTLKAVYQRIRLAHADKLLRQTVLSVTEISVACGFTSQRHFSRQFKNEFGRSPSRQRL